MKFLFTRALVTGALVAAGLSLSSPAMAERAVHRDAGDDLVSHALGEGPQTPVTGYPVADVRKFVVRHGRGRVVMKVTVEELRVNTFLYAVFGVRADGRRGEVELLKKKGKPTKVSFRFNRQSKCRGVTKSLDRDLDQISISIPRRCLDNPTVVEGSAITLTSDLTYQALVHSTDEDVIEEHIFADDALRDGSLRRGARYTWGPELRRG